MKCRRLPPPTSRWVCRLLDFQPVHAQLRSYTDRNLWQKNRPICTKARNANLSKLDEAIKHFEVSLSNRPKGGDSGHDFMRERIEECVQELRQCRSEREGMCKLADRMGAMNMTDDQFPAL